MQRHGHLPPGAPCARLVPGIVLVDHGLVLAHLPQTRVSLISGLDLAGSMLVMVNDAVILGVAV